MKDYHETNKRQLCQKLAEICECNIDDVHKHWTEISHYYTEVNQKKEWAIDKVREIINPEKKPMKERWELAEELVPILGYRKDYVFAVLKYLDINAIKNHDVQAIQQATEILKKKYHMAPRTTDFNQKSSPEKAPVKSNKEGTKDFELKVSQMRLLLWCIGEIGDLEEAKVAFESAYNSLKGTDNGGQKPQHSGSAN